MTEVASAPPRRRAAFHELRVAAVDRLTDDSVRITFDVPPELADDYRFLPGQHVSVRHAAAGDDVRRNYSICSTPRSGLLQIAVKQLPDGVFSTFALTRLHAGDSVEVMTPTGRFTVEPDPSAARRCVAIAAGSGITPIIGIVTGILEVERGSEVVLLYGNRTTQSIMFLEELEDLKNRYPARLSLYHVLSRERQDVDLLSGRLEAGTLGRFLDTLIPPADVDAWYLCGPQGMIVTARDVLMQRGVERSRIHAELFHAEDTAPVVHAERAHAGGDTSTVTVVLDGRSSTFELARDGERILDAALRVRPDAPYACKGGVCGTCRSRVLEGTVRMDTCYALEDREVEAGFVLACQSHPASERVTIEFDQ